MDYRQNNDQEGNLYQARKSLEMVYTAIGFGVIAGVAAVTLFFDDIWKGTECLLPLACVLLFGGLMVLSIFLYRMTQVSYLLNDEGIRRLRYKEVFVNWSEVYDINLGPASLTGDMTITLYGQNKKKLLTIYAGGLDQAGRRLLDDLFEYLAPIFDRNAREYLSGTKHWGMLLIKDVVRIEEGILYVEFPKGKKQAIPLSSIQVVELVPGVVSGAKQGGHVYIKHDAGEVEVKMGVLPGFIFFLYALKYIYGLRDRINPNYETGTVEEIDKARVSQGRSFLWMICALGVFIGSGFLLARGGLDYSDRNAIRMMGLNATATVLEKTDPNKISMEYTDEDGEKHEVEKYLKRDFYDGLEVGDRFEIQYHPAASDKVLFEGIGGASSKALLWISLGSGVAFLIGAVMSVIVLVRALRTGRRCKELENAARVRLHELLRNTEPVPMSEPERLDAEEPSALPETGSGRVCRSCSKEIAGHYYLSDGKPWCKTCKEKAGIPGGRKVGCGTLFYAAVLGGIGAFVAASLWVLAVILTGYELGIVAIVVGLVVGWAVKKGSGGVGGRRFQALAALLTFFALAYGMTPVAINEIRKDPELSKQFKDAWNKGLEQGQQEQYEPFEYDLGEYEEDVWDATAEMEILSDATYEMAVPLAEIESVSSETMEQIIAFLEQQENSGASPLVQPEEPMSLGKAILFLILIAVGLVALIFIGPVVVYVLVLISSPFSLIFLAIAMWEAWRLNKRVAPVFTGPFVDEAVDFGQADYNQ